jgi:hypothetical protein
MKRGKGHCKVERLGFKSAQKLPIVISLCMIDGYCMPRTGVFEGDASSPSQSCDKVLEAPINDRNGVERTAENASSGECFCLLPKFQASQGS